MSSRREKDRRDNVDKQQGDRRFIVRFHDSRVLETHKSLLMLIKITMIVCTLFIIKDLVYGFTRGGQNIGIGFIKAIGYTIIIVSAFRYHSSIKYYLENESVTNMALVTEKLSALLISVNILAVGYLIIYTLTQI